MNDVVSQCGVSLPILSIFVSDYIKEVDSIVLNLMISDDVLCKKLILKTSQGSQTFELPSVCWTDLDKLLFDVGVDREEYQDDDSYLACLPDLVDRNFSLNISFCFRPEREYDMIEPPASGVIEGELFACLRLTNKKTRKETDLFFGVGEDVVKHLKVNNRLKIV